MKNRTLLFYTCFWLSISGSAALFGNKSDREERRRRLSQNNMAEVDADAATGTVKKILTKEEEAAAAAANSCDGQMAQSLVRANEAMLQSKSERDEALTAKAAALTKIAELEKTIESLNKDLKAMETSKDKIIGKLEAKVNKGRAAVEAEFRDEIDQMKQAHVDELASRDEEMQKLKLAHSDELASHEADKEQLKLAHAEEQTKLQADVEARVAAMEEGKKTEKEEAERVLSTTKEEAKKFMVTQVNAVKEEMTKLQAKYEEKEKEHASKIKELDDLSKSHQEKTVQFEKMSSALKEEVNMWRDNHAKRRYINFTDIYVDACDAAEVGMTKAGENFDYYWTKLGEHSSEAYHTAKDFSKEKKKDFDKFYDEQYAIYWPEVEPHYNKHVVPMIKQKDEFVKEFTAWKKKEIDPKTAQLQKEYNKYHLKAVKTYGKQCKSAMSSLKEFDLPNFDEVNDYVQVSCNDPDTSVRYIRNGLLILFMLPFRRFWMPPILWVWGIVWYILLTITPLGFFFSKKKAPKSTANGKANGSSNGVRVKKKGKIAAQ